MAVNIKNEETTRLIHELARRTGTGVTEAVTIAVKEKLDRTRKPIDMDRVMEITREMRSRIPKGVTFENYDEFLYDEDGLPK